jgi:type IV secretory pathway TrbD component
LVGVVGGWVLGIRSLVWYAKSYPEMYAEKMRRATR